MFWYEEDVQNLNHQQYKIHTGRRVVFYGSSTIRLWNHLEQDFEGVNLVNLGFGGSTLAACVWYFERILIPYQPETIVLYAGDNDLGDNRHPEEVLLFFQNFLNKVNSYFGTIPVAFISIKPSPSRYAILDRIRYTNRIIQNEIEKKGKEMYFVDVFSRMLDERGFPPKKYFEADGLHISREGYLLWKEHLLTYASKLF